jgi:hypothetical protein
MRDAMRTICLIRVCTLIGVLAASTAAAQQPEPETREALVEQAQADKVPTLQPYAVTTAERLMTRVEDILSNQTVTWHPWFQSAALGGGLPLGIGYLHHTGPYNYVDARGSYTVNGYKRAEAEFVAPRLFQRRATLSIVGGWRDATEVAFYGVGPNTSRDDHASYGFKQGYGSALLTVWPTWRFLMLRGGAELTQWSPEEATGVVAHVDKTYTPSTLPALGATTTYVHTHGTVAFDWRPAPGYARRGGFYGVTAHDYADRDERFGFREVDYEVVQHVPILRESWVVSLRGLAETTYQKGNQEVPFYLLPHLGGGSTLRGFDSWRFRDRNKLLLQAEWRITANRFVDTAVFYDAGKVAARPSDLDFKDLRSDYGFGVRFHTPFQTAFRVDVARSNETMRLVFSTASIF